MKIDTINGKDYSTYNEGITWLNEATGRVTIVASDFEKPVPKKRDTTAATGTTASFLLDGVVVAAECVSCC